MNKSQKSKVMKDKHDVRLEDDGTLDTVISVDGREYRYDTEFASQYRDKDGRITKKGWKELKKQAISDYESTYGE